jgi:energy-coupling factor transporter ATP-binding protein EcfA2
MFTFNDTQRARLDAIRAWHEEGERRFDFWNRREAQVRAAAAFGAALAESGLRSGRALSGGMRARLVGAAAALAPNGNLSRRLYASDPKAFDDRLRGLLFGEAGLYARLESFLGVRGTGAQTASGLLCAFAPDAYPLVTRPALRRLALTPGQRRAALAEAGERYGFAPPESGPPSATQSLLALFLVYERLRDALGLATYPEADEALRTDVPFSLDTTNTPDPVHVREPASEYTAPPSATETALLAALEEYTLGQGLTFPAHRLRSYYVALKTRPFAILSGVSGSGKTRLAEAVAGALTGHDPAQSRLLPVRPDWNDSTPLFGYHNVLANRYVATPFLDLVRAAARPENRHRAFFVCLDEMNLARVEHYLADYLSALESRAHRIPLHEDVPDLVLPPNLFVTGTVNVDEAAHGFSRKVLDRANTLDFDELPILAAIGPVVKNGVRLFEDLGMSPLQRQALFLGARVANVGRARERLTQVQPGLAERALSALQAVNDLLYVHRLHFAYRVRDDVLMFLANSFDSQTGQGLLLPGVEANFALALDLQVVQKVLPRLHGASEALAPLLARLQGWADANTMPRTAAKLARMRAHGEETGFVRFYE